MTNLISSALLLAFLMTAQLSQLDPATIAAHWQPWQPPPALAHWVASQVPPRGPTVKRLHRLHRALVSPSGLGVREASGLSDDSREVWRKRRADCVGFAYLFAGAARSLGLKTVFVVSGPGEAKSSRRGIKVAQAHLAVGWWQGERLWIVDFAGVRLDHRQEFTAISDRTAAAILWSNRGSRFLLNGHCEEARRWSMIASLAAPNWPALTANRLVVERRCASRL